MTVDLRAAAEVLDACDDVGAQFVVGGLGERPGRAADAAVVVAQDGVSRA